MINQDVYRQKLLTIPRDLVAEVDQFRAHTKIASKSECWRRLIRKGLDAEKLELEILEKAKEQRLHQAA
jgi:metal-responsive CopG/Arc/MetJ family transcriptional regulator